MTCKMTWKEMNDICVTAFQDVSPGEVITRDTPLAHWSKGTKAGVWIDIKNAAHDKGCAFKTISGNDLDDETKVGKTVGTLADNLFEDLTDTATASYVRGYRDASTHLLRHVLTHLADAAAISGTLTSADAAASARKKSTKGRKATKQNRGKRGSGKKRTSRTTP